MFKTPFCHPPSIDINDVLNEHNLVRTLLHIEEFIKLGTVRTNDVHN